MKHISFILVVILAFVIIFLGESRTNGMYYQSKNQISNVKSDNTAMTLNNLGNTYLIKSKTDSANPDIAIDYYNQAIEKEPNDPGIKLNLGIAYLIKGYNEKADSLFKAAFIQCEKSREKVYHLLGMDYKAPLTDKGTVQTMTETQLKENLEKSFSKVGPKKIKSKNKKRTIKKKDKKKKPTRRGGTKSLNPDELKNYLYWNW